MATIQELAAEYARHFKAGERESDDTGALIRIMDNPPDEMAELVFKAHGGLGPDDFRYEMIEDALYAIADADDLDEAGDEFADGGSVYTSDQLKWLSSNLNRPAYCDEYVAEMGGNPDTMERIAGGIYVERREVFQTVLSALEDLAE